MDTEYEGEATVFTNYLLSSWELIMTWCADMTWYVLGTQKNRLNETVLLSTQNVC